MTVSDRFVLFMRELGTNQKDLAEKINYPRTNLSNFVNGNVKSPKIDLIVALAANYPELNLNWLLIGEGEMWHNGNSPKVKIQDKAGDSDEPSLKFLGQGVDTSLLREIIVTKDALIDSLQKQIHQLEQELERFKSKS